MQISYEDFSILFETHFVEGKSEWMFGLIVNQEGIWKGRITERELSFLSPEEKGEIFTLCEVNPTKPILPFPTNTSQLEKLLEELGGCREEFERYDQWIIGKEAEAPSSTQTTPANTEEPKQMQANPESQKAWIRWYIASKGRMENDKFERGFKVGLKKDIEKYGISASVVDDRWREMKLESNHKTIKSPTSHT